MRLLTDSNLTPEQRRVLERAFSATLRKLGLVDRNDPICEIVARKVIEIAGTRSGLDDPAIASGTEATWSRRSASQLQPDTAPRDADRCRAVDHRAR
jgi:hypothetical protein